MFFTVPAIVKVICVFALILILNRVRLSLSLCLFIGSLALGLWMQLGPAPLAQSAFFSLTGLQTVSLVLIVGFILVISRLMKETGHMERIVESFSMFSRDDRVVSSAMPALIGLLPMPGGALFSAPMVETTLCERPLSGEKKTAVNYWFRHIWEYWWPLYPGVVLAVTLLEVDTWRFMAIMAPMTLVTVLAGAVFILRPLGKMPVIRKQGGLSWTILRGFLWEIMPILIVVLLIMALAGLMGLMALAGYEIKVSGGLSILPGLLASMIWVCVVN
ncbi:MAG: DUF401 family protein, partial [Desulfobacterales bacterium]|nr:DUF401 family protein [Desulfobacterales bacterium]